MHIKTLPNHLYFFHEMFYKTSPFDLLLHQDKATTRIRFLQRLKVRQKLCGCELMIGRQSQNWKY